MNKIGRRSTTPHTSTTLYILSRLASNCSYGRRWNVKNLTCQKKALVHLIHLFSFPTPSVLNFGFSVLPFWIGLHVLFHESRLESSVLDLPTILLIKLKLYCGYFASLRNSKILWDFVDILMHAVINFCRLYGRQWSMYKSF